ncbi:hypothetical protein D3C78_1371180 [compost metagenome]
MHQSVLMHADIHEGAKGGDIGDRTLQQHARLQIGDLVHTFGKGRGLEARARVAAGLFQFGDDVFYGGQTELLVDERLRIKRLQRGAVAHQRTQIAAAGGNDLFRHAIGLRVNRGSIQRLLAVRDAQEARALLEGALAEARHLQQFLAAGKRPGLVTMGDDGIGNRTAETGDPCQKRRRGRVEIDADGVHRIFHHSIE